MLRSALLNVQRKTSQSWPIFRRGTIRLNLKSIRSHICFFFSVIEAQTVCKCFIGLFIMSLIFKRSRSTLAMSAKIMLRWGQLACTFFADV